MIREMRRKNQQLSQEECVEILQREPRGVLAVLGDDDYPYAVPMDFFYRDGKLYFHSAIVGHKLDAIDKYEKASFCVMGEGVPTEGEWWLTFKSVIAFGRVHRVEDEARTVELLTILGEKYLPPTIDIPADIAHSMGRVLMLEMEIDHLTGKLVREK